MRWLINKFLFQPALQLYNSFPWLMRYLPGPHHTVQRIWNNTKDFIRVEIKEHKQKWDPSDPRDYIDCYLKEIQMVILHAALYCLHCVAKDLSTQLALTDMTFHCGTTLVWHEAKVQRLNVRHFCCGLYLTALSVNALPPTLLHTPILTWQG